SSDLTTLVWFLFFPREAAGAMDTRHSPRPPGGRKLSELGRIAPRECGGIFCSHCEPAGRANARPMTGSAKQSILCSANRKDGLLRRFTPRNDGLTTYALSLRHRAHVLKRFAQKPRALQPIPPGQLDSLCDADPYAGEDLRLGRAGVQCDRRRVEREPVVLVGDAKRFRQLARPRAQRSFVDQMPS